MALVSTINGSVDQCQWSAGWPGAGPLRRPASALSRPCTKESSKVCLLTLCFVLATRLIPTLPFQAWSSNPQLTVLRPSNKCSWGLSSLDTKSFALVHLLSVWLKDTKAKPCSEHDITVIQQVAREALSRSLQLGPWGLHCLLPWWQHAARACPSLSSDWLAFSHVFSQPPVIRAGSLTSLAKSVWPGCWPGLCSHPAPPAWSACRAGFPTPQPLLSGAESLRGASLSALSLSLCSLPRSSGPTGPAPPGPEPCLCLALHLPSWLLKYHLPQALPWGETPSSKISSTTSDLCQHAHMCLMLQPMDIEAAGQSSRLSPLVLGALGPQSLSA